MDKPVKKIGLFTSTMIVIGSMIGAGIVVVPGTMIEYGFAGIVGWILSAICSIILAQIFVDITLSQSDCSSLSAMVSREYGSLSGFLAGMSHGLFIIIGSSVILATFIDYLFDCINLNGNYAKLAVSLLTVWGLNLMHAFTDLGFRLLSSITILKVVLFGICALLGITEFNLLNVLGVSELPEQPFHLGNIIKFFSRAIQASSVALFAFAGLENAAASSDVVKNPKVIIPKATMIGVALCSFIYIFTQVCVANALGSTIKSATPVKTALSILINNRFGATASNIMTHFVSIVAMLGCLGTLLALVYVGPNVIFDAVRLANHEYRGNRSRTGLPIRISVIFSVILSCLCIARYAFGFDMSILGRTADFLLVYFYFCCTLAHFKLSRYSPLSLFGFAACIILLSGCNAYSVFVGTVMHFGLYIFYALMSARKPGNH